MEISIGFFLIIVLILIPGIIFRRLFYYNHFIKQFHAENSFLRFITISSIPGAFIFICVFFFYDIIFQAIDSASIVDFFKALINPTILFKEDSIYCNLNSTIKNSVLPFLGFLYLVSCFVGFFSGRLIRLFKLDNHIKLFRFRNEWFYRFYGESYRNKRHKVAKSGSVNQNTEKEILKKKKHLFTVADLLIETNNETYLYSGIVLDYEIDDTDYSKLTMVTLGNARKYKSKNGYVIQKPIPGNLFVVPCEKLININLTYFFEEIENRDSKKIWYNINVSSSVIIFLLLPLFIFQSNLFPGDIIEWVFKHNFWYRIVLWLFVSQVITFFIPYTSELKSDDFIKKNWKHYILSLAWLALWYIILRAYW